jgi:hypothetical protein
MESSGLDSSGIGQRSVVGSYKHGDEPLGSLTSQVTISFL